MLEFKKIELPDKKWIDELLGYSDFRATEYSFTTIFIWAGTYNSQIARYKDWLVIRSVAEEVANYVFPAGRGDLKDLIEALIADAQANAKKIRISTINPCFIPQIEEIFPNKFTFTPTRDSYDYIYLTDDLLNLVGSKYQPKRNLISGFKKNYQWEYELINHDDANYAALIDGCKVMTKRWCQERDCESNESLAGESEAVGLALDNFKELNLQGALVRIGGEVVGYTIGEPISSDTFIVHIEKAFIQYKGLYQYITNEFVRSNIQGFKYVSREDDAGDEGLRKAKLSYYPVFLEEKYIMEIKK